MSHTNNRQLASTAVSATVALAVAHFPGAKPAPVCIGSGARPGTLHFGADFDSFACRSSFSLWYPFLTAYLLTSRVAEAAAASRLSSCTMQSSADYCNSSLRARSLIACAALQPRNAIPFGQSCFCHDAQSPPLAQMRLKLPDRAQT